MQASMVTTTGALAAGAILVAATAVVAAVVAVRRSRARDVPPAFLDALPEALVVADETGAIVAVNKAAESLLGYAPGELNGRSVESLLPPEVRDGYAERRIAFTRAGESQTLGTERVETVVRKDGSTRSIVVAAATWKSARGVRFILAMADDEARRLAEADARAEHRAAVEAGALSEAIIRGAGSGVLLYEAASGRCVMVNPAASSITGLTEDELLAQQFRAIQSWKGSGMLEAAEESLERGARVSRDVRVVTSAGKAVDLGCDFMAIELHDRPHLVLIITDHTERRSLEAQLRVAQKMEAIGQLAGGVAHDFNNLLTVIGTYSSLLMDDFPEGDSRRDDITEIHNAAKRASALTRQLLAFGRRQLLEPRVLDLNEVIAGLEKMLRRVLSAEITLDLQLAPDLWTIHADSGQIEQVVMNLVVNARDAMPDGGRLTIQTQNLHLPPDPGAGMGDPGLGRRLVPRPRVAVRITDTGVGMNKETIARIFEPFFTTKPAGKGTGLGLATAYGIVKQSGGTIHVASDPGRGTTFELLFPRTTVAPADAAHSGPAAVDAPGTGDVLVVEDDAHVRRIVVDTLTSRGYAVTVSSNGREALEVAFSREQPPDLVVTDIIMPEMNGRELVERLRERWPGVRVLFTTAYSLEEFAGRTAAELPGAILKKPFVPSELGAAVREALAGGG